MKDLRLLLELLSDGQFHSGQALGGSLGVSRARVWQYIKELSSYGLTIESLPGKGYRLSAPVRLLDSEVIRANFNPALNQHIRQLEIAFSLDSTNAYLMKKAREGAPSGTICLAEHQSSGKGRRGRNWISPLGQNIYLSLLWHFTEGPARLGGVSLLVAMAVVEALRGLGIRGLAVKWPNDIYAKEGKVGGILMELAGESNGPSYVVIGIGLNVDMSATQADAINQPWGNIPRTGLRLDRNQIVSALIIALFEMLQRFQEVGAESLLKQWVEYDLLNDKTIELHLFDHVVTGIARGVNEQGYLVVEHDGGTHFYSSGEVSVRECSSKK